MKTTKRIRLQAKQLFRLCFRDGLLDEARAQDLVKRVAREKSRGSLAILMEFQRWLKLYIADHSAIVESATSLPPDSASQVRERLLEVYGPGLNVSFAQNPALIGGIRVTVGSDVYDGSVRGRLAELQRSFS